MVPSDNLAVSVVCHDCGYMEKNSIHFHLCPCCGESEGLKWYEYIKLEEKEDAFHFNYSC